MDFIVYFLIHEAIKRDLKHYLYKNLELIWGDPSFGHLWNLVM